MDNYAGNVQSPQPFQLPGMPSAAGLTLSGISGLSNFGNVGAGVLPQAQTTAQNLYNNPFSGAALGGAQGASALGQNAALTGYGTGQSFLPYATDIFKTGFDPQQDLYARTLGQVQDQTRAGEAARGIATTPYGAGLENDATRNFNIDWQNAQLGRQATAGAAGAGLAGAGVNMMNAAPGQLVKSAMLPYATYSDIGQGQNQALSSLLGITGQGESLSQMPIQDLLAYLGVGNQANSVANQLFGQQLNQSQLGWNQMGQLGSGIGSLASTFLPFLMA